MTGHIDPQSALALAALPEQDAERLGAWEHAARCRACRALLEDGAAMLHLIDAAHAAPAVDPALKARVKIALFRPRRALAWEVALALFAAASLLLAWCDGQLDRPLALLTGLHCMLYEISLGMVPALALLLLDGRGLARRTPLRVATLVGGFALVGQLLLRSRCPVHDAALHLGVFHVGGVALAALLGAYSVRWRLRPA